MNSKIEHSKTSASSGDIAKYALALLLVIGGVVGFYWFEGQWPTALRVLLVIVTLALAAGAFLVSNKGVETREFLSEARFELRKVVWPTRQEALRMTWVVILVVILISLLMAGFDVVIQWAVTWLLAR